MCAESSLDSELIRQADYNSISAEGAFSKQDRKKRPVQIDNSRQRDMPPRPSAMAAETALINSQLDRNTAPSLFTVSSQPVLPPTDSVGTQRPLIVEVLQLNREQTRFNVLWGPPTHDWSWLNKTHLMQWEKYREVMEAYARKTGIVLDAATEIA